MLWAPECSCSGRGMSKANISAIWCSPHLTYRNNCFPHVKAIGVTMTFPSVVKCCQEQKQTGAENRPSLFQPHVLLKGFWSRMVLEGVWRGNKCNWDHRNHLCAEINYIICPSEHKEYEVSSLDWATPGLNSNIFCFHCELNLKGGSKFKNTSLQV